MSDAATGWLVVGFGITWLLVALYALRIARTQRKLNRQIDALSGG